MWCQVSNENMDSRSTSDRQRNFDLPRNYSDTPSDSSVDDFDRNTQRNMFVPIKRYSTPSSTGTVTPINTDAIPQSNTKSSTNASEPSIAGGETEDTGTESWCNEIILSVYMKKGILGAASYSIDDPIIYVVNDVADSQAFGFKILECLLIQVQPTYIVVSEGAPAILIDMIKQLIAADSEPSRPQTKLHLQPSVEFRNDNCLRRVLALRLPSKPKDWDDECHVRFLGTVLDFSAHCMIQALGGLLKFLDKNISVFTGSNDQSPFASIRTMSLDEVVAVDQETYKALGIFPEKKSTFIKWAAQRDGKPSVFGFFDRCRSALGSKFMESIFLKPMKDLLVISERQEVIAFGIELRNDEVLRTLQLNISQIKAVTPMIRKLQGLQANTLMWKRLHTTLQNVLHIAELCGSHKKISFFSKIRSLVKASDLSTLTRVIGKIVDFDAEEGQYKFVVKPGVDEALDRLKMTHAKLPSILNKVADCEIDDLPEYVLQCIVTYYPEIGFLLAVQQWKDRLTKREMQIPGYDYKFLYNGFIHYKSKRCSELDEALGDPVVQIAEIQLSMMIRLVEYVQRHLETIADIVNMVAELDCLISLATVAREHNYVKPEMTKEHIIDIVQGRHLLEEELLTSAFVPNDVKSSENAGFVKIITGANNTGKTVYLKQSALIVFLAHIGSFVPAQKATIEVMDRISTLISTTESTSHRSSAFLSDMRQISKAVTAATPATLIVLDEFGRNTTASDGKVLFAACLNYLLRRGPTGCPHVMSSTHFHSLRNMLVDSHLVVDQKMDQMFTADGEITNLYRIVDGRATCSVPIQAAIKAGLPQLIISRAEELMIGNAKPWAAAMDSSIQMERDMAVMEALLKSSLETEEDLNALVQSWRDNNLL